VRRHEIAPGEKKVLCREGEYGSTAFLLQGTGTFEIYARGAAPPRKLGFFEKLFGARPEKADRGDYGAFLRGRSGHRTRPRRDDLPHPAAAHRDRRRRRGAGQPAARTHLRRERLADGDPQTPRSAGPVVVYEVTRNLLDMMQRAESARGDLEEMYSFRAIQTSVMNGRLFAPLSREDRERAVTFLLSKEVEGKKAEFRRVSTGESIVAEGDTAAAFYIVRLGTVKVFTTAGGGEQVLAPALGRRLLRRGRHCSPTGRACAPRASRRSIRWRWFACPARCSASCARSSRN